MCSCSTYVILGNRQTKKWPYVGKTSRSNLQEINSIMKYMNCHNQYFSNNFGYVLETVWSLQTKQNFGLRLNILL